MFTTIDWALGFLTLWHLEPATISELARHTDQWNIDVANALRMSGAREAYRQVLLG